MVVMVGGYIIKIEAFKVTTKRGLMLLEGAQMYQMI
jgi:hypothetical protein